MSTARTKRPRSSSLERDIKTSHKRLCDIKRKERAIEDKIKDYDDRIRQLYRKRDQAQEKKKQLKAGPWEAALLPYSRAWTLSFATKLRTALPRELRDMVYAEFWNADAVRLDFPMIRSVLINPECPGRPCQCLRGRKLPTILDPTFVGQEVALEAAESFYKTACESIYRIFSAAVLEDVKLLCCNDAFHLGLDPANVLRELNVLINVEELTEDGKDFYIDAEKVEQGLAPIMRIKNKSGFRLRIELSQRHIRLNVIEDFFHVLKTFVETFEQEGADSKVLFMYRGPSLQRVEHSLNAAILGLKRDWKKEMIRLLDSEPFIAERHRDYAFENDSDYQPDPFNIDSELDDGYDSEDSFYSDEYWGGAGFCPCGCGNIDDDFDDFPFW